VGAGCVGGLADCPTAKPAKPQVRTKTLRALKRHDTKATLSGMESGGYLYPFHSRRAFSSR
jgi:hypothetical protein